MSRLALGDTIRIHSAGNMGKFQEDIVSFSTQALCMREAEDVYGLANEVHVIVPFGWDLPFGLVYTFG